MCEPSTNDTVASTVGWLDIACTVSSMTLTGPATCLDTNLPSAGDGEVAIDGGAKVRFDMLFCGLSAFGVSCTGVSGGVATVCIAMSATTNAPLKLWSLIRGVFMRTSMKKKPTNAECVDGATPKKKKKCGILKKLKPSTHKRATNSTLDKLEAEEENGHICLKCKRLFGTRKKCKEPVTPKPRVTGDGKLSDDAKKLIRMMALKAILPKRQHAFAAAILQRFETFEVMKSQGIRELARVSLSNVPMPLGRINAARIWVLVE